MGVGGGGEGARGGVLIVGCRLKFRYFVGSRLKIVDLCWLSVNLS